MDMIKKTQYKFIAITISAISLVLILILGVLNSVLYVAIVFSAKQDIEQIEARKGFVFSSQIVSEVLEDNAGGIVPDVFSASGRFSYMYIRLSNTGDSSPVITTNMSDTYSANDIYSIASVLIDCGQEDGVYKNMMFKVTADDLKTTVTIVDLENELSMFSSILKISVIIIILSLIVVFAFTYYLSRWAIGPVKTALDRQRRFISDASHELKTPLTVISANADVLESEIGSNKWLSNIKSQSVMMSELVYDLLDLAKLDETKDKMVMSDFDLSSAVLSKALEFECTAFENHKTFEQNIKENVRFKGNEESIKQLITILIDNAIKHSDEGGTIRITLTTTGSKRILQVYNTGVGIKNDEKDRIFERFYRSDKSRSRDTGGYGLGLSIAKSIALANNGTISVDGEENKWISFTVILG